MITAVYLLFLTTLPASAGSSGATADYARQVSAAQLRAAQLEALLAAQQQRIEQLEEVIRLQGQSEANRLDNIDQVNDEIARLRGEVEVVQFGQNQLKDQLDQLALSVERRLLYGELRLRNIEGNLRIKPPPPPTDAELGLAAGAGGDAPAVTEAPSLPANGATGTEAPAEMPPTAAGKLKLAAEHTEAGRFGVARAILKTAIEQHIGEEEVAEARYRLAETFSFEQNWKAAIFEYDQVVTNHRKSPWACWAYYRQGEAVEKLKGPEAAQSFYKPATSGSCKGSEAAAEAAKKL